MLYAGRRSSATSASEFARWQHTPFVCRICRAHLTMWLQSSCRKAIRMVCGIMSHVSVNENTQKQASIDLRLTLQRARSVSGALTSQRIRSQGRRTDRLAALNGSRDYEYWRSVERQSARISKKNLKGRVRPVWRWSLWSVTSWYHWAWKG